MSNRHHKRHKSDQNIVYIPIEIENNNPIPNCRNNRLLTDKTLRDDAFQIYMESMPEDYFSLFEPDEVVEHFNFIKRHSLGEFGVLPDDISIKIESPSHVILICRSHLPEFGKLLEEIENNGRKVIHHHAFFGKLGNYQVVLVQTTQKHFKHKHRDESDLSIILQSGFRLIKKRLVHNCLENTEEGEIYGVYPDLISEERFGEPCRFFKILESFTDNLNIGLKRALEYRKVSEMSLMYAQMILNDLDSLCYIRRTPGDHYRVTCMGKSPAYLGSQKYLSFITDRLSYYQDLIQGFEFRGGFSSILNYSPTEQIEFSVAYIKLTADDEQEDGTKKTISLENELAKDLAYKVVPRFNDLSLFDIVGPIMVGPSSSHTAGANRLGRLARHIIGCSVRSGKVKAPLHLGAQLYGSFKLTGEGHGTYGAVLGGLIGMCESDERMSDAKALMEATKTITIAGMDMNWAGFKEMAISGNYHENTVFAILSDQEEFSDLNEALLYVAGESYGGGNVQISEIGGKIPGKVYRFDTTRRTEFTGKKDEVLPEVFGEHIIKRIVTYPPPRKELLPPEIKRPEVVELDDIMWYAGKTGKSLPEMAMDYEMATQGIDDKSVIYSQLDLTLSTFKEIVEKGIKDSPGTSKFSGGNGNLLSTYASRKARKDDRSYLKAAGYAIAVAERNAAHKKIIAAPTAGASGILPGVLYVLWEEYGFTDYEMYDGILVAAFIGLVINNIVPTAGATHGCQAETGIGSAMAAAMAAHLLGGDTYTAVNAAVLALKNNLGMVCDPIAGRVEIPCIKRNGFKAVEAIVAARMSLAGMRSNVSASEIVKAMDEIGKNMKAIYKETSEGGLAGTIRGRDVPRCGISYKLCCGC